MKHFFYPPLHNVNKGISKNINGIAFFSILLQLYYIYIYNILWISINNIWRSYNERGYLETWELFFMLVCSNEGCGTATKVFPTIISELSSLEENLLANLSIFKFAKLIYLWVSLILLWW